jgi:hypothetical protein
VAKEAGIGEMKNACRGLGGKAKGRKPLQQRTRRNGNIIQKCMLRE